MDPRSLRSHTVVLYYSCRQVKYSFTQFPVLRGEGRGVCVALKGPGSGAQGRACECV